MTTSTRTTTGRWRRIAVAATALSLVAAACGSDDDGDSGDDTSDTEAPADGDETESTEAMTEDSEAMTEGSEAPDEGGDDAAAASGLLGELQEAGTVTVGLANEIPYGYETEEGEIEGEAPDVAAAVLAELGIDNIEAEVVDFGALIPGLQAGQYDMIAAGMFITPERAEQIIFSDPDYCGDYSFAVAEGNPEGIGGGFDSIVETGATLAVLSGAVDETYAADAQVPEDQIELFADVNAQYDALLAGRVDAVGGTSLTVNNQTEANEGIEATDAFIPLDADGNEVYGCGGFGFTDQDFRDAFNDVLHEKQDDGTVMEIVTSYGFSEQAVETAAGLTVEDLTGG
ncbi:ectoine/hydroxyectoine ABC transporter substrate-binding protein EhuB [Ilumatobacter nonamiensis]|uniref:ectoine/hydroxyectoine ABC transporter substrate-binding protein EhuB n=1 Tax=Ilumatobacter nonamiensis TaxID=467093 RepID=UPI00034835EA|nr:ectoine/hydroxyectoine ABC transporter substrate-binding protein EhuB [Ilumatobacter nonamiensis]